MPPIELDPIPDPAYPEGSVVGNFDGSGNPYEKQELLHRPHAFALMHGDDGAKVAYGQLMWRVDRVDFAFEGDSVGGSDGNCIGAGQGRAIKGLDAVIPKLNSSSGDAMDPTIPNIYHQLDGYGDVYLFWEVDLAESEIVVSCWVEASGAPSGETPNDIDDFDTGNADHDRFAGVDGSLDSTGIYRVKLGTVNEGALIAQDISSDVYWSTVVLTRDQAS
jgi:hypothetical protein